jgi:hypothetical protein
MERKRRRLAFLSVVALALCVTAGLSAGAVEAKKKKKNKNPGGTVDLTMPVNAQVPDATATTNGVLISTINVPSAKPFIGTEVRDVNVTLQTTGSASGAATQVTARVTAPNGATSWLFSGLSGQSIGPLTLDDESPNYLGGATSTSPNSLASPYAGTAQPNCAFVRGGCPLSILDNGPATGVWTLRVYDIVAAPAATSVLNSWRLTMVAGRPYLTKKK